MANGWIRCISSPSPLSVVDTTNDRIRSATVVNEYRRQIYNNEASTWLAQANYIFDHLEIPRGFENFGIFSVSRSSNCSEKFPQCRYVLSFTISRFLDQQTICFLATSFCAPWPSSK
jgi:Na+/H+ antiporter NhaD/arsenite permease-like protein